MVQTSVGGRDTYTCYDLQSTVHGVRHDFGGRLSSQNTYSRKIA